MSEVSYQPGLEKQKKPENGSDVNQVVEEPVQKIRKLL